MEVAYVYYLVSDDQLGVEKKIRQQARAIKSEGLDLDILVLNPYRTGTEENASYLKLRALPFPLNYYEYLFRRYRLIERNADLGHYDYLVLRYPLADSTGPSFTDKYRVITEHNADEAAELQARLAIAKSPIERVARKVLLNHELAHAAPTLQNCKGLIGVTHEITALQAERAGGALPTLTIGNGINVDGIPATGFKTFEGDSLDIVFLGASLRPWHGLDRIIDSFNRYHGRVQLTLHVVGNISQERLKLLTPDLGKVKFYGPRQGNELDEIMANMHLAISSMGMYKRNLNETAALKLREYTARGLPFVLANKDPDLAAVNKEDRFFLTFENDDSLLDVERIIAFADEVSRRQETLSTYMRDYARTIMDWRVKLRRYLGFINDIAGNKGMNYSNKQHATPFI